MMEPPNLMRNQASLYTELFEGHYDRVLRLCRLLLADHDLAEEVCQDVFLKLHVRMSEEKDAPVWERWLTRVAVNGCRDVRRRRWWKLRTWTDVINDDELRANVSDPETAAVSAAEARRIHKAFQRLSPRQREVFVLRHIEEWTTTEVAAALRLDAGTVKRHLFRAVAKLRHALGEDQ